MTNFEFIRQVRIENRILSEFRLLEASNGLFQNENELG